jgi:lysozyme
MCFPTPTKGVVPEEPDALLNDKDQPTVVKDIDSIKKWEGLRLEAYMPTPNDVPTIGYGHTKTARMGMVINEAKAERLLRSDLEWSREAVNGYVDVPLSQEQYDALVSFVFNVGGSAFRRSTLLRKLNAYDYVGAADEFPRWNKQKGKVLRGLTNRRMYERAKFLSGTTQ